MKIMAPSKGPMLALPHSVPPTLQQATADPRLHQRLLDTHGPVWVSLLWGHCSFLLGPGAHKVLLVPSKSLFPQSCVNSGSSMVGLMATSSKRAYAIPRSAAPRAPAPVESTADPYLHRRHSNTVLSQSPWGLWSWCTQSMFEPSEHVWRVWGLILSMNLPLLPPCWGFSFALDVGYLFTWGISSRGVSLVATPAPPQALW